MIPVTPVILCGGSGTRLWPLSRSGFPKQFLCLTGDESLFQQAVRRLAGLGDTDIQVAAPLVVCNEQHRFLVGEQVHEIGIAPGAVLLEPYARNTAPALTLAALCASHNDAQQDPVLVVAPADQTLVDPVAFTASIQSAIREAATGRIVVLGVAPDHPETGYGYIQARDHHDGVGERVSTSPSPMRVLRFVEKPDRATAQRYLDAGGYYWNAGMFVLRASLWLQVLDACRPDIARATKSAWDMHTTDSQAASFVRPGKQAFASVPGESIDYAVMEKLSTGAHSAQQLSMVPLKAGWSDLGAWDAVWKVLPKDKSGNAHLGDVVTTDSRNTLVHATSRLVGLVGVDDIVVVETADAVMVADKARSQNVKQIVASLQGKKREEHALHRKVHRPWGWYDSIDEGARFKVKRIQVKPGASLSLQKHQHRAEHWIVVKGTAEVTRGDQTFRLEENQSTYISPREMHRLANPGTTQLEIIEVQSGDYLGEDDIERFDDHYGRT